MTAIETALTTRLRLRTVYSMVATLIFSTFLGLGAGSLMNEWYALAAILLSLSAASIALTLTVCGRGFEYWLDRRHPLKGTS